MKKILVTGGTGFIGSHTVIQLQEAGFDVYIVDDLSNSDIHVVDQIKHVTGIKPSFSKIDLTDLLSVENFFTELEDIDAVIHFAAHKAVGESVDHPLKYYHNNLTGIINLLSVMTKLGINDFIFSSSATVYGDPDTFPVQESDPVKSATSPYGNTKKICEDIVRDTASAHPEFKAISLRYFNPVGAHESGLIGELPQGVPNNLMPFITQTAAGIRPCLSVFGGDYQTPDGTCIRDYIHVVDLAEAHVKSVQRLLSKKNESTFEVFNLGTGVGYSVLDVITSFEKVNKVEVKYEIVDRRAGDVPVTYASTEKANNILGWSAKRGLDDMTKDAWRWEVNRKLE